MLQHAPAPTPTFPCPTPPAPGSTIQVAPGLLWVRLALPYRLDHVNVYLIDDGTGWALLDTGIDDAPTRAAWDGLLAGPLRERPLTRVLVTHYHPDHIGLAGWLCERFGLQLAMSQTDYLVSRNIHLDPGALNAEPYRSFYRAHGLDADTTERLLTNGHRYLRMVSGLPRTFRRLIAGERIAVGSRSFEVLTGGGHAPEQVMLFCRAENLFVGADQVLARISPNISVQAMDPEGDPLGIYLRSLAGLKRDMPTDVLVLPGHNLPFVGLHARIDDSPPTTRRVVWRSWRRAGRRRARRRTWFRSCSGARSTIRTRWIRVQRGACARELLVAPGSVAAGVGRPSVHGMSGCLRKIELCWKANRHVAPVHQDRALRFLEIADHVGPHRRAIDRALGRPARRRIGLLAGSAPARAGSQRRRARRCGRDRYHSGALQCPHARARIWRRRVAGGGWSRLFLQFRRRPLYRLAPGALDPRALTPAPSVHGHDWRFADGVIDRRRNRWIGVREDHTAEGEPVNAIVAVDLGFPLPAPSGGAC